MQVAKGKERAEKNVSQLNETNVLEGARNNNKKK